MIICIKNIEINKKKLSDILTRISVLKEIFYDNDTIAFILFYIRNGNATNFVQTMILAKYNNYEKNYNTI